MNWFLFLFVIIVATDQGLSQNGQCRTPYNLAGQCVAIRSCSSILNLIQGPLTSQSRYFLQLSQCGFQNNQPLVCCPLQNSQFQQQRQQQQSQQGSQFQQQQQQNQQGSQFQQQQQGPSRNQQRTTGSLLPQPGVCGVANDDRIFGGERTKIDEFPWMVLLKYIKPSNPEPVFLCGGTLISDRYVLTASHCVHPTLLLKNQLIAVRLGEWDLSQQKDCDDSLLNEVVCAPPPIDIAIEEKIMHEKYSPSSSNQHNDIALLRMRQKVTYGEFIRPICLPTSPSLRSANAVGEKLTTAGWGKTESGEKSDIKLKVLVPIYDSQQCSAKYKSKGRNISTNQICAGGNAGEDSCRGDSGGPLMGLKSDGIPYWYLAGVVSYGPVPCGQQNLPGVYTKVSEYIQWIESKMRQ
ncbi:unnamed protein product [Diamesa serratosioi]